MARVQRLLDERIIRQVTPIFDTRALGYSSMLVAAKVDAENPHRAAKIINAHPGVSHNYLRNHEFNLWFTIATEPDSKLGLEGTLDVAREEDRRRVDPPAADAQAVQDPHGPRDGEGTEALAGRRPSPVEPRRARPDRALRRLRHRRRSARCRATCRSSREPYAPAAERARHRRRTSCSSTSSACRSAALLRRVAAILFHRRAGFSANGMGVWKVPEEQILEVGRRMAAVPRHLALLPAPDLRGLALLRLHDGPRPLEGGVRRDPRLDRRDDGHHASARRSTPRPSSRRSGCSTSPTTSSAGSASTPSA